MAYHNPLSHLRHNHLFSVDALNEMVKTAMPFSDAYKTMGKAIENGNFKPKRAIKHTHEGSLENLCLEEIKGKMDVLWCKLYFRSKERISIFVLPQC